ncbi:MAG: methyltransferase domain-containing protein [Candidatus Margulisiibacteriota bacterium]
MYKQFDKAAKTYNNYAEIQVISTKKLMSRIDPCNPKSILDIGCGTGLLTKKIARSFPKAAIDAIDISIKMIDELNNQEIPNVNSIYCDFNNKSLTKKYGLVTSNAAIHWMNVGQSLKKISNILSNNGSCYLAIFGPKTSVELRRCLSEMNRTQAIVTEKFPTKEALQFIGNQYFFNWKIDTEMITLPFNSIIQLLKTQKNTGVNHKPSADGLWTPRILKTLQEKMLKNYGQVQLSYEIHFCKGSHHQ